MQGMLCKLIQRYGASMILMKNGEESSIRAFLQESRSKSTENTHRQFLPVGELPRGRYVYIGPAVPMAEIGDLLIWQDRVFEVRQAEAIVFADQPIYCWGLCVERGGDSVWGS